MVIKKPTDDEIDGCHPLLVIVRRYGTERDDQDEEQHVHGDSQRDTETNEPDFPVQRHESERHREFEPRLHEHGREDGTGILLEGQRADLLDRG